MSEIKNLTGQRFGRLLVIRDSGKRSKVGEMIWLCECGCGYGNMVEVRGFSLRSGHTKSCNCLLKGKITKHGESGKTNLYKVWINIKQRCSNKKLREYKYYGGKGIRVCRSWQKDYLIFKSWALTNGYQQGLTIDRIDSNGDYCPENCQWIPRIENIRKANRERWNKLVEVE